MFNQQELAQRFKAGATHGRASNVRIVELSRGETALVGYGWAVYAIRNEAGEIISYRNWHGYSPSTSSQMTKMGLSHPADVSMDPDTYRDERPIADAWNHKAPRLADVQEGVTV